VRCGGGRAQWRREVETGRECGSAVKPS